MKFPSYRQLDGVDCGPTCLRMIASYYGKEFPGSYFRSLCGVSREGVTILSLKEAAEKTGFRSTGLRITYQQLRDRVSLPCILYWNQNHFVVVYGISRHRILISDPAAGHLVYSEKEFLSHWLMDGYGIALMLTPTPAFYGGDSTSTANPLSGMNRIIEYVKPYRSMMLRVVAAMFLACFLNMLMPLVTQSMLDEGVSLGRMSFVVTMLLARMAIIAGQTVNEFLRSWIMLQVSSRVSISLIADYLVRLMRMPISFFEKRQVGDIIQRIGDHERIHEFLTVSLPGVFLSAVLFVSYGTVLGAYRLSILAAFLLGTVVYLLWVLAFLRHRRRLDMQRFESMSENENCLLQIVAGMPDIKLFNCSERKLSAWEIIQSALFHNRLRTLTLSQLQHSGAVLVETAKNLTITGLGALAVVNGEMTLGMMLALEYVMGQLSAPVKGIVDFADSYQDAHISMERLSEIYSEQEERTPECHLSIPETIGDIALDGVSFSYGMRTTVLDDVSLVIPEGKMTAVVGLSGSGKSTILKLILGLYPPSRGRVTAGGIPISHLGEDNWKKRVSCVLQEGFIFSDTIAGNIALQDLVPDMERVRRAAETACISDWIDKLPMGYATRIGGDGHGLSTGQKQRILIARAVYKDAPLLVLDEATNALDSRTDRQVFSNLKSFFKGKTVVMAAHRLSTIRDCDLIIVLENGKVMERGTHSSLIRSHGIYHSLVQNQLEYEQY